MENESTLIDILHHGVFDITRQEHRQLKNVPDGEELEDYMTSDELRFQARVMHLCTMLHQERNSHGFEELSNDALDAARIVRAELLTYEAQSGKQVVTSDNEPPMGIGSWSLPPFPKG